jgi:hypothetical protein
VITIYKWEFYWEGEGVVWEGWYVCIGAYWIKKGG